MSIAQKCKVEGCDRHGYFDSSRNRYYLAKGMCMKHYSMLRIYGRTHNVRNMSGYSRHPLFGTWRAMISRCYNDTTISYKNYGARGIKVCDRWRRSFKNFLEDMGDKPSQKHTLDRIDNDGDYEPGNCKWSSRIHQAMNKRVSVVNKSGKTGVYYITSRRVWEAKLEMNGTVVFRKRYKHKEDAIKARINAETLYIK